MKLCNIILEKLSQIELPFKRFVETLVVVKRTEGGEILFQPSYYAIFLPSTSPQVGGSTCDNIPGVYLSNYVRGY